MRLRLRCSSAYSLGDFQCCMLHVPEHTRTVRDLAAHVSRLLELNIRGGQGDLPQLLLGGFLVPHEEEVRQVLRDDEVVDVEPPGNVAIGGNRLALQGPSHAKRSLALPALPAVGDSGERNGAAAPKKARGAGSRDATMALGWQAPSSGAAGAAGALNGGASAPAQNSAKSSAAKPAKKVSSSSSESSSDEAPGAGVTVAATGVAGRGLAPANLRREAAAPALAAGAAPEEVNSGCSIFVGGLPLSAGDEELRQHFQHFGPVLSAAVVQNERTGKSKCFGFVEFASAETRDLVLAEGSKQMLGGKLVEIKPRQAKGYKGSGGKDSSKGVAKGGGSSSVAEASGTSGQGSREGAKTGKGGSKTGKGKAPASKAAQEESSDDSSSSSEGAAPKKQAAPKAKAKASIPPPVVEADEADEAEEMQRQMAALGLPVSFKASVTKGGDSDDEEEEEEEDEGDA